MKKFKHRISIIGLGYIGFPFLLSLVKGKFGLIGVDNNKKKINALNGNYYKCEESGINYLYNSVKKNRIFYSSKIVESEVYILCLPTPLNNKNFCDTSILKNVTNKIIGKLKNNDLLIVESTVPTGYTEKLKNEVLKKRPDLKNLSFGYVCEKAMPGNTLYEMTNNDRIIGCEKKDRIKIKKIYKTFVKGKIYFTDFKSAEAIKLVENTFRDFNIGLAHYLKNILKKNKINYEEVFNLSNKHPRVNILNPSIGVGGHCLPVDPYFLDNKKTGLISKIRKINDYETVKKINELKKILLKYKNKKICFWGLGYKPGSLDLRNSPALKIYNKFRKKNCYASEINNYVKVKNFLDFRKALRKCNLHIIMNLKKKDIKKYFKNKKIININNL